MRKAGNFSLNQPPDVPGHSYTTGSLSGSGQVAEHTISVNDTKYPLAVTLIMPGWSNATTPDFDMYLYDPDGHEVARSTSATRQETIGAAVSRTGNFKLKVNAYAGSGNYYFDVSGALGSGTAPPPQISFVQPAEGATVSGMVRVTLSAQAGTVAKVELAVGSGAYTDITSQKDSSGNYYSDWNTTGQADGPVTLHARLTDSSGATATADRGVSVANHQHQHRVYHGTVSPDEDAAVRIHVDAAGYVDLSLQWQGAADLDYAVYGPDGDCVAHPGTAGSPEAVRVNTQRFGTGTYTVNIMMRSGSGETGFTLSADSYAGQAFGGQAAAGAPNLQTLAVTHAGTGRVALNWEGEAVLALALFAPDGRLCQVVAGTGRPLVAGLAFPQPGTYRFAVGTLTGEAASYTLHVYLPAEALS